MSAKRLRGGGLAYARLPAVDRRWEALSAAILLALAFAVPEAAAQTPDIFLQVCGTRPPLACYHAIVDAYAAGDQRAAAARLSSLGAGFARNIEKLLDTPADPNHPWDLRRYAAAAMLHTDAAIHVDPSLGNGAAFAQLEVVTAVIAARRRGTLRDRSIDSELRLLAQRWYLALSRYLRDRLEPYAAERLLELGRQRIPRDPVILAESGTLAELLATIYALVRNPPVQHGREVGLRPALKERAGNLDNATRWLRQASTLAPDNEAVRLHLGRVLALRQEDQEALEILAALAANTRDSAIAYLAHLFAAGVNERSGRLDEAASSYRAAIARLAAGQAAPIGLSEVLQRLGRGDESRQVLGTLLAETAGPPNDPFWVYHFDPTSVVDERLTALRKDALR